MHEYRRLVETQMEAKKITGRGSQSKLASLAGVSRQVISVILNDSRERLNQAPDQKTVNGLAKAFDLEPEVIWTAVAVSMGMPSYVVPSITHEVRTASDEDLLGELAQRFGLAATFRSASTEAGEAKKTTEPESWRPSTMSEAMAADAAISEQQPSSPRRQRKQATPKAKPESRPDTGT